MRTLNEMEMSAVSGGVDPIPCFRPDPMPRPDPEEVYWLQQTWKNPRFELAADGRSNT